MNDLDFQLPNDWGNYLNHEFSKQYMVDLKTFLQNETKKKKIIYPKSKEIFQAFYATTFSEVKVVILGQDPYHGPNQAHGMSFSVKPQVKIPPSLKNIFKELHDDLGISIPNHGYLESWAKQGVLLLNSVLTVEQSLAHSHRKKGWEVFTDKVIEILNEKKENLVFILWGSPAQKKAQKVDKNKHFIINSVHPSPLSAHRGFFGTKPFSKTNAYLKSKSIKTINWNLA